MKPASQRTFARPSARKYSSAAARARGLADRAVRLGLVTAIAEAARRGEGGDLVVGRGDAVCGVPQRELPQARGVDEKRPRREREELAVRRRVAAAPVRVTDLAGRLAHLAEQGVDERRLPGAGGAEEGCRRAGDEQGRQVVEAVARHRAHGDDGGAAGDLAGSRESGLRVGHEVRFRQDDGRRHARLACEGEEALEMRRNLGPARAERLRWKRIMGGAKGPEKLR